MEIVIAVFLLLVLKFWLEKKHNIEIGCIQGAIIASLIILSMVATFHFFYAP